MQVPSYFPPWTSLLAEVRIGTLLHRGLHLSGPFPSTTRHAHMFLIIALVVADKILGHDHSYE